MYLKKGEKELINLEELDKMKFIYSADEDEDSF